MSHTGHDISIVWFHKLNDAVNYTINDRRGRKSKAKDTIKEKIHSVN